MKAGNILLNDVLNTFYLWLYYGTGHMAMDYSGNKRGNTLPPLHELLFLISSKYVPIHRHDSTHTTVFYYTSCEVLVGIRFFCQQHAIIN